MIAALFVDPRGSYAGVPGVEMWDEKRDARNYAGPHPIVAHPPCHLWVNMAACNWKRYKRQRPAWYAGGDDNGCFLWAFVALKRYGGVLEHPAFSHAFKAYGIPRPAKPGWNFIEVLGLFVCEVWQSAYGHRARKRTWLIYIGKRDPFELSWQRPTGSYQIGWFDRKKPTLNKREAIATPPAFRDELIKLANWSKEQ